MGKRYVSIWFPSLRTDWYIRHQPLLKGVPFVLTLKDHGRLLVTAGSEAALAQGIYIGMPLADARAIVTGLQYFDDEPERSEKLLNAIAEWSIRYTPVVGVNLPEGLLLDASGCAHLWGGEEMYLTAMYKRFHELGYHINIAIADTIGTAWAFARYGKGKTIIPSNKQTEALLSLPAASLRLEPAVTERLEKLGLRQINQFINMPRPSLRRRFGKQLLSQLDKATGAEQEFIKPITSIEAYQERLPCLEPIATATGIAIALQNLLDTICNKLRKEEKGLRSAIFKGYRMDGKLEQISIGTTRPSANPKHLFRLFEDKITTIEPALGIELFVLEAPVIEEATTRQEKLWGQSNGLDNTNLAELIDRLSSKLGGQHIHRYVPDEHYWPERSFKESASIHEPIQTSWKTDRPRPLQLLANPQPIEVTAPVPDYPPMNFRYKGKLHIIANADGPERIEQEWWIQEGQHRDYYYVEDEEGHRYWLFRSGHYDTAKSYKWFLHGFFA
ncbi:DNA polymerase Y family protein [soil metagenome]